MIVLGLVLPFDLLKSAAVAYIHYLSFMLCFGALIYERISLKADPNRQEAISMVFADIIYGIAGIALFSLRSMTSQLERLFPIETDLAIEPPSPTAMTYLLVLDEEYPTPTP